MKSVICFDVISLEGRFVSCSESLSKALSERVVPYVSTIEPNWAKVVLTLSEESGEVEKAWVNGPLQGDTSLKDVVLDLVPKEVLQSEHMRQVWFVNPDHRVELLVGRAVIDFENCQEGYVSRAEGDTFEVTYLTGSEESIGQVETYTRERLEDELTWWDTMAGQAVGVTYAPFLTKDGTQAPLPPEQLVARLVTAKARLEEYARERAENRDEPSYESDDPETNLALLLLRSGLLPTPDL